MAQLPPIKGAQTFFSPAWKRFFPLFLSFSRRQQNDLPFYALLQNMRMGMITDDDRNMILEKVKQPPTTSTPSETTFVTGFKQLAHNLNTTIASQLPLQNVFLHTVHKTQGLTYSLIRYFYVRMWPSIYWYEQGDVMAGSGHHVLWPGFH